jgi:hypothetical protein
MVGSRGGSKGGLELEVELKVEEEVEVEVDRNLKWKSRRSGGRVKVDGNLKSMWK